MDAVHSDAWRAADRNRFSSVGNSFLFATESERRVGKRSLSPFWGIVGSVGDLRYLCYLCQLCHGAQLGCSIQCNEHHRFAQRHLHRLWMHCCSLVDIRAIPFSRSHLHWRRQTTRRQQTTRSGVRVMFGWRSASVTRARH